MENEPEMPMTSTAGRADADRLSAQGPETPSGKAAGDENFPVGSALLPAALRPDVACYYAFARAIDDIADNPALAPDDKIARLDGFEAVLMGERAAGEGFEKAARLRACLLRRDIPLRHGADLCVAFRQDAIKPGYADWTDLMGYCENSANPVGRFLIDLHGEDRAAYAPSDALCSALQVLNHLQDCGDDYRALDRVYLPRDWLAAEGASVAELDRSSLTPEMRRVIDRSLDATDQLIAEARALPGRIANRRFAMECATIVALAVRLSARLRANDPLAQRVALSKWDFGRAALTGIGRGLFGARPRATSRGVAA